MTFLADSMLSASITIIDPTNFMGASGEAIDSGASRPPPNSVSQIPLVVNTSTRTSVDATYSMSRSRRSSSHSQGATRARPCAG